MPDEGCGPGETEHQGACVLAFVSLCAPCETDADCASPGAGDMRCVSQGSWGSTSHPICASDEDCPAGTACVPRGGVSICAPDSQCLCSPWAAKTGRATA